MLELHRPLALFFGGWWGYAHWARQRAQRRPSILATTNQWRRRWMLGCLQIFLKDNPLFCRGLSLRHRVGYFASSPGGISCGATCSANFTTNTIVQLTAELFKAQAGVFAVHIPFAGGPPAQLALVSGQVDFNFDNLAAASASR